MRSLPAQFAAFPVPGEVFYFNCNNLCTQKNNDYWVTFIPPLLLLSLFYSGTSLSLFWVMQVTPKAGWELVQMMQHEPLLSQHVSFLLLLNYLSTVAVSGSSLLCGQTFLTIKKLWSNCAGNQKTYVFPLPFSPEYRLLGTKLTLITEGTCICYTNWSIFQKWLLHSEQES